MKLLAFATFALMQKRWVIKEKGSSEHAEKLVAELNVSEPIAQLLLQRGITTFEKAKSFFRPSLLELHNPFLMKDMDKAIERLTRAVANNERIMVYGDYDVDGTTAVALVYSFLKKFHANTDYYIPDRYTEGYGISFRGVDYAEETGVSLIIALDCGIKSLDKVNYANEKEIDFIICDHHLPGEELPKAAAVLDPKRTDCTYPYKELSGCGIGFKLIQAYASKAEIPFEELHEYLDLTAISIASDIVHITGENRILSYHGIERINKSPRPGIKSLLELNNVKQKMNVTNLVFIIGPRINAAGRISSGRKAVEMLISDSPELAKQTGILINQDNEDRKGIDKMITAEALEFIRSNKELHERKTTVLFNQNWHKGVVGIVASRLTENYYRPTILLAESNGMATGSARSVKDFDVYRAIEMCSDLIEQFGGHKYAAGLTIKKENIEAFSQRFEEVVASLITPEQLIPPVEIDLEISLSALTKKFFRIMQQMAPFGPENMNPVFVSRNVKFNTPRLLKEEHLKLELYEPENPHIIMSAIGFNMKDFYEPLLSASAIDICYTVEENNFNGKEELQLKIKDIKYD
jgi:single-stranded-DNA-specific exonuclease